MAKKKVAKMGGRTPNVKASATAPAPAALPAQASGLPKGTTPADFKPVEAPLMNASGISVSGSGSEFTLVFTRTKPMMVVATGQPAPIAMTEPIVIVTMSPQSLKDISIAIGHQIAEHEKAFGEIQTAFTQRREAEKKTKH